MFSILQLLSTKLNPPPHSERPIPDSVQLVSPGPLWPTISCRLDPPHGNFAAYSAKSANRLPSSDINWTKYKAQLVAGFSKLSVRLGHVRGSVGRSRSLISLPPGRLAA